MVLANMTCWFQGIEPLKHFLFSHPFVLWNSGMMTSGILSLHVQIRQHEVQGGIHQIINQHLERLPRTYSIVYNYAAE